MDIDIDSAVGLGPSTVSNSTAAAPTSTPAPVWPACKKKKEPRRPGCVNASERLGAYACSVAVGDAVPAPEAQPADSR